MAEDTTKLILYFGNNDIVLNQEQYDQVLGVVDAKRAELDEYFYNESADEEPEDIEEKSNDLYLVSNAIDEIVEIAEEYVESEEFSKMEKVIFGLNFLETGSLPEDDPDDYFTRKELYSPIDPELLESE